ncbi:ATP-grasp domain-containing protein [Geoglobus acetivorans]|uniref:ATP-grasp domain-containing protein n=1 Tax=Geoglobus acetivorans TaxID=565033 RepID=A0ABZ3H176_GEOAI|nr:ATP-grasp domain-containing protein [Geoglobus acetivorans]
MKSKLFIYEHGVCGEKLPESIAVEGLAMFKSMLDFSEYYDLVSFVRPEFRSFFRFGDGNFDEVLEMADHALIVAPENDWILRDLTKKIEKAGVENFGSSSKALRITSDKWELYRKLKNKVNVPETSLNKLDGEYVVKPRVSCGGDGIKKGGEVPQGYIAQELVDGKPLSFSFYVNDGEIHLLSVNEQILEGFEYRGAIIPAEYDGDAVEEAIRAVEVVEGLNGFVGVDAVAGSDTFVIEINGRLTTPSVAFKYVYGMSYAGMREMILKNGHAEFRPLRRVMLLKGKGDGYVQHGEHSIILKTIQEF